LSPALFWPRGRRISDDGGEEAFSGGRERVLSAGLVVFSAMIEILQLYIPGRHARWIDFVVDAIAAVVGILIGAFPSRTIQKRRP
jgi:VanZ family protein